MTTLQLLLCLCFAFCFQSLLSLSLFILLRHGSSRHLSLNATSVSTCLRRRLGRLPRHSGPSTTFYLIVPNVRSIHSSNEFDTLVLIRLKLTLTCSLNFLCTERTATSFCPSPPLPPLFSLFSFRLSFLPHLFLLFHPVH